MSPARDPESTRRHILEVTAEEMRQNGFKATSLADILQKAAVSKGALYHHFANKQELGYAVFHEVFIQEFLSDWNIPMSADAPIDALCEWMSCFGEEVTEEELEQGCPIYNIATEMAALDEGFREMTSKMFEALQKRLFEAIKTAKDKQQIREDVQPSDVAAFVVAAIQGSMMQGKYGRDLSTFKGCITCLVNYLSSLKK